jgi:hypothetical protein
LAARVAVLERDPAEALLGIGHGQRRHIEERVEETSTLEHDRPRPRAQREARGDHHEQRDDTPASRPHGPESSKAVERG